ncbi:MAG: RND transporter, partial [Verrucomicrobia bacterium]|nr:RND transporter [Verrucomicrobiota bacterium]
MKQSALFLSVSATAFAALPAVGPDYSRPSAEAPSAYREADLGSWKTAAPADTTLRGEWWKLFG